MNISGQPELVDQQAGIVFCRTQGIPLFLMDPCDASRVRGSFPIIQVDQIGIRLVREGHFPAFLFHYLLDSAAIDVSNTIPPKFPVLQPHSAVVASNMPAYQLRREIIARLNGAETG